MPYFRFNPLNQVEPLIDAINRKADASTQRLTAKAQAVVQRLTSGKPSPLDEMRADNIAAQTAHQSMLARLARARAEEVEGALQARRNPDIRAKFAGHSAGMDEPNAVRLGWHLRGELEPYHPADADDAAAVGAEYRPYRMAAPNLQPGQAERFQSAMAASYANDIATGKSNAPQLAAAASRIFRDSLTASAAHAEDVPTANRYIAAASGKAREPFALGRQGQVLNQETGAVDEEPVIAQAARERAYAQIATEEARQRELDARAEGRAAGPLGSAPRETALERNMDRLVQSGIAPDQKAAFELLRKQGKSEQEIALGLAKVLMSRPGYMGKEGAARAMADAKAIVEAARGPVPRGGFRSAEDVRAAYREKRIDRATAIRELQQFGFDPE